MPKAVLGVVVEVFVAVATAGLVLAVLMPLLIRNDLVGTNDIAARGIVTAVLGGSVALALFRPGSAIRRRHKR